MICNRCGAGNDDWARFCAACGHKLQSREPDEPGAGEGDAAGDGPGRRESGGRFAGFLPHLGAWRPSVWGEMAFVWVVALALAGGAAWAVAAGVYWPLYPLTGLAALAAWLRFR